MPPIKRVESTAVLALGYNKRKRKLRIVFKGGVKYVYKNVPPDVYERVVDAQTNGESVGKLLHQSGVTSKPGSYDYERIPKK